MGSQDHSQTVGGDPNNLPAAGLSCIRTRREDLGVIFMSEMTFKLSASCG